MPARASPSSALTSSARSTTDVVAHVRRRHPPRLPRSSSHDLLRPGSPRPTTRRRHSSSTSRTTSSASRSSCSPATSPTSSGSVSPRRSSGLIEELKVKSVTWVHAIPMPVPHTRPIGVTVSGNRAELIDTMSIWKPHTQVPANALHLRRVPAAAARVSDRRIRPSRPALPGRHRVSGSPRSQRSRASVPPPA